jgi:hypothetical protein
VVASHRGVHGAATVPFDGSELDRGTAALIAPGFTERRARPIICEDVIRLLEKVLPKGGPAP